MILYVYNEPAACGRVADWAEQKGLDIKWVQQHSTNVCVQAVIADAVASDIPKELLTDIQRVS